MSNRKSRRRPVLAPLLLPLLCLVGVVVAVPPGTGAGTSDGKAAKAWKARVEPASEEAEMSIGQFRVPEGFKVELFAAEPRLANPVAFHIDEKGRFYVV